jgi:hypothetical protein
MSEPVPLQPGEGVIRCPAVRSLIKDGELKHEDLQTAAVQDLVRAFSGQDRDLAPNEPGSLANVAGFFAIVNHGMPDGPEDQGQGFVDSLRSFFHKGEALREAAKVADGKSSSRRFDLRLLGSKGDHPGTVNFFKNDESGEFQTGQFNSAMAEFSDGQTLTVQGHCQDDHQGKRCGPESVADRSGEIRGGVGSDGVRSTPRCNDYRYPGR